MLKALKKYLTSKDPETEEPAMNKYEECLVCCNRFGCKDCLRCARNEKTTHPSKFAIR